MLLSELIEKAIAVEEIRNILVNTGDSSMVNLATYSETLIEELNNPANSYVTETQVVDAFIKFGQKHSLDMAALKAIACVDHDILTCPDCDGFTCEYCDGKGYFQICRFCRSDLGNKGRAERKRTKAIINEIVQVITNASQTDA